METNVHLEQGPFFVVVADMCLQEREIRNWSDRFFWALIRLFCIQDYREFLVFAWGGYRNCEEKK